MQLVKSIWMCVLDEFKLKNFGFTHRELDQFYRSQWQLSERSFPYLIIRWLQALFFIGVFLACVTLLFCEGKVFIFLTNWGIILCMIAQLLGAILVTQWYYDLGGVRTQGKNGYADTEGEPRTPCMVKLYWLVHHVALMLALIITTVYWIFLYGKMNKPMNYPAMSFICHCLNSVFMLVDFLIVAFPVRLLHTAYAMLLPTIFCFFTVVYYFCGGTDEFGNPYVYPILDWKTPLRGVLTFIGVFVLYLIYGLIIFGIYKLKCMFYRAMYTSPVSQQNPLY